MVNKICSTFIGKYIHIVIIALIIILLLSISRFSVNPAEGEKDGVPFIHLNLVRDLFCKTSCYQIQVEQEEIIVYHISIRIVIVILFVL